MRISISPWGGDGPGALAMGGEHPKNVSLKSAGSPNPAATFSPHRGPCW